MFTYRKFICSLVLPAATAISIGLATPDVALAQSDAGYSTVWERFQAFNENSEVRINHQPLDEFLFQTVLPVGRSRSVMGTQARQSTYTGSRIRSSTSAAPSKYEGNRVLYHAFTEEHGQFLKGYKEGLERLSNRRPLAELNKNEQLAYWLNLYNVTVMLKTTEEYPVQKLKNWRQSKKQTPFWQQNSVTVEGVPLSLVDIEQILFRNWDDPRVMYGLYQASIGGPSLPNAAFTADNVWVLLNNNTLEFVNSNRGVRAKGVNSAEVSKMYDWASAAFGNSDEAIIAHIKRYADAFHGDMMGLSSIKPKYYDWNIADLTGGTRHKGQHTQLGGVLVAGSGEDGSAKAKAQQAKKGFLGFEPNERLVSRMSLLDQFLDYTPAGPLTLLPDSGLKFLEGIITHNDLEAVTPSVTVIDCELEECEQVQPAPEQPVGPQESRSQPSGLVTD